MTSTALEPTAAFLAADGEWSPPPEPPAAGTGRARQIWFWISGPVLAALIVLGAFGVENSNYVNKAQRAPNVLIADLVLLGALCVVARFRWPRISFLVAAAVPLILAVLHGLDGPTELATLACLIAIGYRCSWPTVGAAGVLAVGQGMLLTRWDRADLEGVSAIGVVIAVAVLLGVGLAARGAAILLRRHRGPEATTVRPARSIRLGRPGRAALACLLMGSQLVLVWYSHTYWPTDPATSSAVGAFCGQIDSYANAVQHETNQMLVDTSRPGSSLPERRELSAAAYRQVADRSALLASRLRRLAEHDPVGTATRAAVLAVAGNATSRATDLRTLIARLRALPATDDERIAMAELDLSGRVFVVQPGHNIWQALADPPGSAVSQRLFHHYEMTRNCYGEAWLH